MNRVLAFLSLFLLAACNGRQMKPMREQPCVKFKSLLLEHAKGFAVDYYPRFKVITLRDVNDNNKELERYVLLPKDKPMPIGFENDVRVDLPVHRMVCISTNYISSMRMLGLLDSICAVTNPQFVYDAEILARVNSGHVQNVGSDAGLNYERIVQLVPSLVMTYGSIEGNSTADAKLKSLQQTVVHNYDFTEQEPLARAEWLKFFAVFYDKEEFADSVFRQIDSAYHHLCSLTNKMDSAAKPSVFCNAPFKEVWYMPCGENYMARLFADAGGSFLWRDAKATNGLNMSLDYEAVFAKAAKADVWVHIGTVRTMAELIQLDSKNANFKAVKTGKVFNNNARISPGGGSDFWESGVNRPDILLADLMRIFHPQQLPNHSLVYYQQLK